MKALSIIILLALISCHPSKEERQSLSFSKKEFVTEPCSAEPCAKVRIGWEEAVGADAGTHINKTVLSHLLAYFRQDTAFADLETAAKDFVASYNRFKQDFPDSPGGGRLKLTQRKRMSRIVWSVSNLPNSILLEEHIQIPVSIF